MLDFGIDRILQTPIDPFQNSIVCPERLFVGQRPSDRTFAEGLRPAHSRLLIMDIGKIQPWLLKTQLDKSDLQ